MLLRQSKHCKDLTVNSLTSVKALTELIIEKKNIDRFITFVSCSNLSALLIQLELALRSKAGDGHPCFCLSSLHPHPSSLRQSYVTSCMLKHIGQMLEIVWKNWQSKSKLAKWDALSPYVA